MEHAHYVVLFAGLIFGKNPAANHRSRMVRRHAKRDGRRKRGWRSIELVAVNGGPHVNNL
jgi:hypothetical protein